MPVTNNNDTTDTTDPTAHAEDPGMPKKEGGTDDGPLDTGTVARLGRSNTLHRIEEVFVNDIVGTHFFRVSPGIPRAKRALQELFIGRVNKLATEAKKTKVRKVAPISDERAVEDSNSTAAEGGGIPDILSPSDVATGLCTEIDPIIQTISTDAFVSQILAGYVKSNGTTTVSTGMASGEGGSSRIFKGYPESVVAERVESLVSSFYAGGSAYVRACVANLVLAAFYQLGIVGQVDVIASRTTDSMVIEPYEFVLHAALGHVEEWSPPAAAANNAASIGQNIKGNFVSADVAQAYLRAFLHSLTQRLRTLRAELVLYAGVIDLARSSVAVQLEDKLARAIEPLARTQLCMWGTPIDSNVLQLSLAPVSAITEAGTVGSIAARLLSLVGASPLLSKMSAQVYAGHFEIKRIFASGSPNEPILTIATLATADPVSDFMLVDAAGRQVEAAVKAYDATKPPPVTPVLDVAVSPSAGRELFLNKQPSPVAAGVIDELVRTTVDMGGFAAVDDWMTCFSDSSSAHRLFTDENWVDLAVLCAIAGNGVRYVGDVSVSVDSEQYVPYIRFDLPKPSFEYWDTIAVNRGTSVFPCANAIGLSTAQALCLISARPATQRARIGTSLPGAMQAGNEAIAHSGVFVRGCDTILSKRVTFSLVTKVAALVAGNRVLSDKTVSVDTTPANIWGFPISTSARMSSTPYLGRHVRRCIMLPLVLGSRLADLKEVSVKGVMFEVTDFRIIDIGRAPTDAEAETFASNWDRLSGIDLPDDITGSVNRVACFMGKKPSTHRDKKHNSPATYHGSVQPVELGVVGEATAILYTTALESIVHNEAVRKFVLQAASAKQHRIPSSLTTSDAESLINAFIKVAMATFEEVADNTALSTAMQTVVQSVLVSDKRFKGAAALSLRRMIMQMAVSRSK